MISRYPYMFDSQNPSQNPTIDEVSNPTEIGHNMGFTIW